jgi:hypothetical protein
MKDEPSNCDTKRRELLVALGLGIGAPSFGYCFGCLRTLYFSLLKYMSLGTMSQATKFSQNPLIFRTYIEVSAALSSEERNS